MTAVSFELGISLGEISKTQFALAPVPRLPDAFTWFVRCDGDAVTVYALVDRKVVEIGRAAWVRGRLIERVNLSKGFPNDHQWKLVGTALGRVMRRMFAGLEGAPVWRRVLATVDPRSRPILIGSVVMGGFAIGLVAILFAIRSREPHRVSIAQFDRLAWSDVERGGETTVPLILKDPERERGRKLCVTGTVESIERAKVDSRAVHTGMLRIAGREIAFVALGSTRDIVDDIAASFCGVAHGKQIVGLFDRAENRTVERP